MRVKRKRGPAESSSCLGRDNAARFIKERKERKKKNGERSSETTEEGEEEGAAAERKRERERERKKRWKKGGWAKKGEKLEQTKRADRAAATYLDAALQKQERPTRQLGNDPAL